MNTKEEISEYIDKWEELASDSSDMMERAKKSVERGLLVLAIWVIVTFSLTTFLGIVIEPRPVAIAVFIIGYVLTAAGSVAMLFPIKNFYEIYRKSRAIRLEAKDIAHNWILLSVLQDKNFNWKDLDNKFMEDIDD